MELTIPDFGSKEQIQISIKNTFDSVNLINELKLVEELTNEEELKLNRNIEHVKTMISKEWFYNNLTEQQKDNINLCL